MANQKSETSDQRPDGREAAAGDGLVTRAGLAAALKVSVRTVDRMLETEEIKPVRMRGWSVRFFLREVVECLRNGNRKFGRRAVAPASQRGEPVHLTQPSPQGGEDDAVKRAKWGKA